MTHSYLGLDPFVYFSGKLFISKKSPHVDYMYAQDNSHMGGKGDSFPRIAERERYCNSFRLLLFKEK